MSRGEKITIDGIDVVIGDRVEFPTADPAFDQAMLGKPLAVALRHAREQPPRENGVYEVTVVDPNQRAQLERAAGGGPVRALLTGQNESPKAKPKKSKPKK